MAETILQFTLKAVDQASAQFEKVAGKVESTSGKFKGLAVGATIAMAGATVAVADFAKTSIEKYEEAEESQSFLEEAFKRFPSLADTNVQALRAFNDELQKKTTFDDDAAAAAEANLAQFSLTGDQIMEVMPLVADYAARTGKDLPDAASLVGKALLGNAKSLKDVGIKYQATGDTATDFANITDLLAQKVGGAAEALGTTATGKTQILQHQWDDFQKMIGAMLIPMLDKLLDVGTSVLAWLNENPVVVQAIVAVVGVLTVAIIGLTVATWAMNTALLANPITWIILGIVALIAAIVLLVMNWQTVVDWLTGVWNATVTWLGQTFTNIANWWNGLWDGIRAYLQFAWNTMVAWLTSMFLNLLVWLIGTGMKIADWWNNLWGGFGNVVSGIWKGVVNGIIDGLNWVIGVINKAIVGLNVILDGLRAVTGGAVNLHVNTISTIPHLATGGIVTQPTVALIGEAGPEAVVPLKRGGMGDGTVHDPAVVSAIRDLIDVIQNGRLTGRMGVGGAVV